MTTWNLEQQPIHLGLGATAEVEPAFTGMEWWHTADVQGRAAALFVTAGEGTQHRAR
jgi:hypothetical protein